MVNYWITIIYPAITLSILHALIPSHWMPVIALGKKYHWNTRKVLWITFLIGAAHVASTVVTGILVAAGSRFLTSNFTEYVEWIAPLVLIFMGIWIIYRHYTHHHFHVEPKPEKTVRQMIWTLTIAMFFSPCLEIEGQFIAAGTAGWIWVFWVALAYATITIVGMITWVGLTFHGLKKINSHLWEHSSGIITGVIVALSGVLMFLLE